MKAESLSSTLCELHDIEQDNIELIITHLENVISSIILSNLRDGENETSLDLGIGILSIRVFTDSISYQFIPSESLEKKLKDTAETYKDPLAQELKVKIDRKLIQIYRELLK